MPSPLQEPERARYIEGIATDWYVVSDPGRFFLRYAPAIQGYFAGLIRNADDAEDAAQEFFLRITQRGFPRFVAERGRFRDYLKTSIRNAARNYMQRTLRPISDAYALALLSSAPAAEASLDERWIAFWRLCLVRRAWSALKKYQEQAPGNLYHTVLRLEAKYSAEDSVQLAARATRLAGYVVQPAAYRKQVSRARRMLADLLIKEVSRTLRNPSPEDLQQELAELGLWTRVYRAISRPVVS
jgi:RNA polymerase sigma-70 factor (ECF subfamily)